MAFTHGMTRPVVGFLAVAAMIAAYAGATIYFDRSYADPRPAGRKVRILPPPFEVNGEYAVKYGVKVDPGAVIFEDKDELDQLPPMNIAGLAGSKFCRTESRSRRLTARIQMNSVTGTGS
jgi:hypothetical protein